MKRNWQKILAMLCAMTLALTGLLVAGFAEEAPAEDAVPAEAVEVIETPATEPVAEVIADDIVTVTEAPVAEAPVQEAAPAVVEAPAQEAAPAVVETPAQEAAPAIAETPAQEIEAPAAEEPAEATEAPAAEEPAETTEVPAAEEPAEATEVPTAEEPAQATEIPAEETDQSSETPAAESTVPAETPAAEIPAEEVVKEETPAAELIPADMTLKTLTSGEGAAPADHPYIIRLVSNVTGKVKVTLKAASELFVQFGKDGEEISREIMPNEEGDISFTFGAEFGKNYLLYVYSIGTDAETGLVIESVPFRISSEKVEPVAEEVPAEETFEEIIPAETAEDASSEEEAPEEIPAEEPVIETAASNEEPAAEEPVAEEPAAEEPVAEEPAAEEPAVEEALVIYEQADADEEIDEYETALGLYEIQYVLTAKETDIRIDADGMSPIMTTVPEGTALKGFITDDGDWMLVIVNGELGYAYKKDLASHEEETAEVTAEEIPEETAEEVIEEASEEVIEEAVEEAAEEATDDFEAVAEELPELKVTIFTSRRVYMTMGEPVYLTSELEGFEGLETVFQWECDKGEGYEPVEGADEDHYTFIANAESLSWGWKLLVYYR